MIRQGLINNNILEKKYRILRTSILLGNMQNRSEMLRLYEDTARKIDEYKRENYEELLAGKMYTTTSLEEEKERLKDLIGFIENRVKERNDFIDDYMKVTSNFLDDLPRASLEKELAQYKDRLNNICEYLSNNEKIKEINLTLVSLRDELEEKYKSKTNNELVDSKLEDELINEFNKIISNDEYYSSLNYTDIDSELEKLEVTLGEKRDVMNTFISSYEALKNAGISGAEREEYLSYVKDSKRDYYFDLEKKYILNIYKLVLDKEEEYEYLYKKRTNIENLLNSRLNDRKLLEISGIDDYEYFYNLCKEQFSVIKSQKFNIDNIDKLIMAISDYEDELNRLQNANSRDDIVSILNEYSVNEEIFEKIDLPDEEKIHDEIISQVVDTTPKPDNMVVKVQEPLKLNVKKAKDTAKLVMKKVVIVLDPKKFNKKKDKLKEAEIELSLEEEKSKVNDNDIFEDSNNINTFDTYENADIDTISTSDKSDEIFNDTIDNVDNIFESESTVDKNDEVIDNNDLFDDQSKKNLIEVDNIFGGDISNIPSEIFIDNNNESNTKDLFKETDPFLDDNEFEITNHSGDKDSILSKIPQISNIGTVKPNSILSKIEDMTKSNDDIIMPTMGLVKDKKEDVPIVSENYIS